MDLYYQQSNGLKKQMLLVLSQNLEDMGVEHLRIRILLLNLGPGFRLNSNTI